MKNRNYKVYYRFLRYKANCFFNKEIAEQEKKREEKAPPFCVECKYYYQEQKFSPVCVRNVGKVKELDIVTGERKVFSVADAPYCVSERIDFQSAERRKQHCCLDAQFFVRKNVEVVEQPDCKG